MYSIVSSASHDPVNDNKRRRVRRTGGGNGTSNQPAAAPEPSAKLRAPDSAASVDPSSSIMTVTLTGQKRKLWELCPLRSDSSSSHRGCSSVSDCESSSSRSPVDPTLDRLRSPAEMNFKSIEFRTSILPTSVGIVSEKELSI